MQLPMRKWFAIPEILPVTPVFDLRAILPVLIMFIVTSVRTVGDISGVIEGGMTVKQLMKNYQVVLFVMVLVQV